MFEDESFDMNTVDFEAEKEEIVSDLLYTLFATLDEYTTLISPKDNLDGQLAKMSAYVDKEMREYVKALYNVELEPTDYDYVSRAEK